MNKAIVQTSILVGSIVAISSSAVAETMKSGQYQSKYPHNLGIKIENNKFSVYYDDAATDPAQLTPKGDFKYIKPDTFYNRKNKTHYCLLGKAQLQSPTVTTKYACSRNGWTKLN